MCAHVRAYNHFNHEPYISSRRAGDEDEKKPAGTEGVAGKKRFPDCESPAGAKDEHAVYSCFALSDRSRGLCQCPAVVPPPLVGKNDERKVVLAGWTEYIYSR